MDQPATILNSTSGLVARVTCPHCWERFAPEQVLWVTEHVDLYGDPILGDAQQRFLPTRFTPEGLAIDPKGMPCGLLACPRCHLAIPRGLLEMEPLFVSILGAPSSGKSYLLSAMTWQLRSTLPHEFGVSFTDADTLSNSLLNRGEEALFMNPDSDRFVPLGDLVRKTELQGDLYNEVVFGQQRVRYPRPFLFTVGPQARHPNASNAGRLTRLLCLYDNAGEHFLPGNDTTANPGTRHLAMSRALLFLFDPTQDPRFASACRAPGMGRENEVKGRMSRQETLLHETAARVRRHANLPHDARTDRPLVLVLTKLDEWSQLLEVGAADDPWRRLPNSTVSALDTSVISRRSDALRELLMRLCPETVAAAEGFAQEVTYIAVSSLGGTARADPTTGVARIRPRDIQPYWAAVPMLYCLSRVAPALIPRLTRRPRKAEVNDVGANHSTA